LGTAIPILQQSMLPLSTNLTGMASSSATASTIDLAKQSINQTLAQHQQNQSNTKQTKINQFGENNNNAYPQSFTPTKQDTNLQQQRPMTPNSQRSNALNQQQNQNQLKRTTPIQQIPAKVNSIFYFYPLRKQFLSLLLFFRNKK
jgi:hypothetical protein